MSQVIVMGVTQKGKNRINEHGACWNVVEIRNGEMLLESMNRPGYLKWLKPDFVVVSDG